MARAAAVRRLARCDQLALRNGQARLVAALLFRAPGLLRRAPKRAQEQGREGQPAAAACAGGVWARLARLGVSLLWALAEPA